MRLNQIKWMPVLMSATIIGIAAFQVYWLDKAYEREKRTLEIRSNMTFRETVHQLQATKLKLDKLGADSLLFSTIQVTSKQHDKRMPTRIQIVPNEKMIGLVDVLTEKVKDSVGDRHIIFTEKPETDTAKPVKNIMRQRSRLLQFLYDVDSAQDSVTVKDITAAFAGRLQEQNIHIPFVVQRLEKDASDKREFNEVTVGFSNPITYRLELTNTTLFLLKRILAPILLSVFIVGFTIVSFSLLYRNLLRQRRLADIKNEFISNITHELKTPIATVNVAIEALRSFSAGMDPQKSKEYLDISANELQRLSMLVDKVLKLSMFEKKEVDLKYEHLDMQDLVAEVTSSMRLQFEKQGAAVQVTTDGDTHVEGDRLHLVSVLFNLLDNALKYSNGHPQIDIAIKSHPGKLHLYITDNGIGIPADYRDKIFDKFFRVPTGNLHNAKGYGLGLSYVAHVVNKHGGSIKVDSIEGAGCKFSITLPKAKA